METNEIKKSILSNIDWKTVGILFLMFLAVFLLWNTPVVYPIKIFVVILHEFSHGFMAILTGGSIDRIEISPNEGGVCYYRGGNFFLTASAGYLGSIFWGALILLIAVRTKYDNIMGMVIGVFLVLLSILFIRNLFGFFFTIAFGLALFIICYKTSNRVADIVMRFLGMTSCLYAVIDIKDDLISRTVKISDAYRIAESLGLPGLSVFIGMFWIIIAFAVFFGCLILASRGEEGADKGFGSKS